MSRKVLFVDDEPNTLETLRRELREWSRGAGIEIVTTTDPEKAMPLLDTEPDAYELVVSDLRMPGMLGSDLLLRVKEKHPRMMSILLTGFAEVQEVMRAVKAGIFSYILKPWNGGYLQAEIEKALSVYAIRKENEEHQKRVETELRWAGEMQRSFLAIQPPDVRGLAFDVSYRPQDTFHCSGDYYDLALLPGGRVLALLGDVSGHGVTGALMTGILKSIVSPEYLRANPGLTPSGLLAMLNGRLLSFLGGGSSLFVSMAALILDPGTGVLTWSNAGQTPPLVVSGRRATRLESGGPALGFVAEAVYPEESRALPGGDTLLLYTDGLVEAGPGNVGDGIRRLEEMLLSPEGPALSAETIATRVLELAGTAVYPDDVTVIRVRSAGR